jgi:hypothetical protein
MLLSTNPDYPLPVASHQNGPVFAPFFPLPPPSSVAFRQKYDGEAWQRSENRGEPAIQVAYIGAIYYDVTAFLPFSSSTEVTVHQKCSTGNRPFCHSFPLHLVFSAD